MSLGCFEMLLLRSVSMFGSAAVDELAVDPVVAGHAVGSDGGAISVVVGTVAVDIDKGCGVVVDHSAVEVNAGSVHDDVVGLILVVYGTLAKVFACCIFAPYFSVRAECTVLCSEKRQGPAKLICMETCNDKLRYTNRFLPPRI